MDISITYALNFLLNYTDAVDADIDDIRIVYGF